MTAVTAAIDYSAGPQAGGREPAPGELGLVQAFVGRYGNVEYETLTVFALLLILMTFRPQGILGSQWSDH